MTDAPRHTARQIADDVAAGMDPDVECVAAQYCDAYEARIAELEAERDKAKRALERAGFTDNGAQEWKPPIGWGDTGTLMRRRLATQDELARVKAESLRVVVEGEAAELDKIQRHQYVQWEGHVCVPDKLRVELVRITDNHRYDVRQQYCDSFRFTPVRLVRLEDVG